MQSILYVYLYPLVMNRSNNKSQSLLQTRDVIITAAVELPAQGNVILHVAARFYGQFEYMYEHRVYYVFSFN